MNASARSTLPARAPALARALAASLDSGLPDAVYERGADGIDSSTLLSCGETSLSSCEVHHRDRQVHGRLLSRLDSPSQWQCLERTNRGRPGSESITWRARVCCWMPSWRGRGGRNRTCGSFAIPSPECATVSCMTRDTTSTHTIHPLEVTGSWPSDPLPGVLEHDSFETSREVASRPGKRSIVLPCPPASRASVQRQAAPGCA